MAKLIIGCGYVGGRVARVWRAGGEDVFAVTRNPMKAAELESIGVRPIIADITRPATLYDLPACETALFAVGYDRSDGYSIHDVYVGGLATVLKRLNGKPQQIVYLSSTGVYGQSGDEWVDENSPCFPTRPGGTACLAAESMLLTSRFAEQSVILRLAGIYGPDRIPRRRDLLSSAPFPAALDGYLNLIHVDDVVQTILAVENSARRSSLYVVSDGHPVLRKSYYEELCRRLDVPWPEMTAPAPDSASAARASSSKRVRSDLFRAELDLTLRFPDYRAGLAEIATTRLNDSPFTR